MDVYPYALILHVLGAIGVFVAFGLQWVAMTRMRRAPTRTDLVAWLGVLASPRILAPVSMLVLLVTGLYMALARWSMDTWAGAGLIGLIVLGGIGGLAVGRTARVIGRRLPSEPETLSPVLRELLAGPTLPLALWTETGLAIGIVSVMVLKPDFATSIGVLVTGAVVGAIVGWVVASSTAGAESGRLGRAAGQGDGRTGGTAGAS